MPSISEMGQDAINAQLFERLKVLQESQEDTHQTVRQLLRHMHKSESNQTGVQALRERLEHHEREFSKWRERVNTAFAVGGVLCTIFAIVVSIVAFLFS